MGRPKSIADVRAAWFIHLNASTILAPQGLQSFGSPVLDTFKFSQFLAKIAHGFAVDAFGETFVPMLRGLILNQQPSDQRYDVNSGIVEPQPESDNLHELTAEWRVVNGITYTVVRILLFANLGAPAYLVAVGTQRDA